MFKFLDNLLMWITRRYQPEPVPVPVKPNLPRVHSGSGFAL
jgi:hypothetical protein